MTKRLLSFFALLPFILCQKKPEFQEISAFDPNPGALISVSYTSVVASLVPTNLDGQEFTEKTVETLINGFKNPPKNYWLKKARQQAKFTLHKQVYRRFYYPGEEKGQLVFPPEKVWKIKIDPNGRGPFEINEGDNKFIAMEYKFESVVVARRGSVKLAEPALAEEGGQWVDSVVFPRDTDYFLQRTGFACIDESRLSLDSANSFNAWMFFDDTCTGGRLNPDHQCHVFHDSEFSCLDSLELFSGIERVNVTWTRIPYTENVAKKYRVGSATRERDLEVPDVKDAKVVYRYFPPDSCYASSTPCVTGTGWRRLLTFSTNALNTGIARFLNVARFGKEGNPSLFIDSGIYSYDKCAGDFKYTLFGNYTLAKLQGVPIATCVHDTQRLQNHEYSPLATDYDSCDWQGISSGWAYTIPVGSPCQWVDITKINDDRTRVLRTRINTYGFMCEGLPALTEKPKKQILHKEEERFKLMKKPVNATRPVCDLETNYAMNNLNKTKVRVRTAGASTTAKCERNVRPYSEMRNCGWSVAYNSLPCTPGDETTISVSYKSSRADLPTAVVRICESSVALGGVSTRCEYDDALSHAIVRPQEWSTFSFICPLPRDSTEPGGVYSVMVAKYATFENLDEVIQPIVVANFS